MKLNTLLASSLLALSLALPVLSCSGKAESGSLATQAAEENENDPDNPASNAGAPGAEAGGGEASGGSASSGGASGQAGDYDPPANDPCAGTGCGAPCTLPAQHFTPGCAPPDDYWLIEEGCYAPCSDAEPCAQGYTCSLTWINPCRCEPGEACCDACGGAQQLCLMTNGTL